MKKKRRKEILNFILLNQSASVEQLSKEFDVSEMTIRRDLADLSDEGLILRVSGGAILATNTVEKEPSYKIRAFINAEEKDMIASTAAKLVRRDSLIFLDNGTTCLQLAKKLINMEVTIITNWIPNIEELKKSNAKCNVISIGGNINTELLAVGVQAYKAIGSYRFSQAFIGVGGITENGISDYKPESVEIKQRVIECANEVIVLADKSKFGKQVLVNIAPLNTIHTLVVDNTKEIPENLLLQVKQNNINMLTAQA